MLNELNWICTQQDTRIIIILLFSIDGHLKPMLQSKTCSAYFVSVWISSNVYMASMIFSTK